MHGFVVRKGWIGGPPNGFGFGFCDSTDDCGWPSKCRRDKYESNERFSCMSTTTWSTFEIPSAALGGGRFAPSGFALAVVVAATNNETITKTIIAPRRLARRRIRRLLLLLPARNPASQLSAAGPTQPWSQSLEAPPSGATGVDGEQRRRGVRHEAAHIDLTAGPARRRLTTICMRDPRFNRPVSLQTATPRKASQSNMARGKCPAAIVTAPASPDTTTGTLDPVRVLLPRDSVRANAYPGCGNEPKGRRLARRSTSLRVAELPCLFERRTAPSQGCDFSRLDNLVLLCRRHHREAHLRC